MSDMRFRELERSWRAEPDREAAWLRAQLRTHAFPRERLELAAHVGHPPALLALGRTSSKLDPWQLLHGLGAWGREVCIRAGIACVAPSLSLWEPLDESDREAPHQALAAAATWVECPCADHARRARNLGCHVGPLGARNHSTPKVVARAAGSVSRACAHDVRLYARSVANAVIHTLGSRQVVNLARAALVPYALGRRDPLSTRLGRG